MAGTIDSPGDEAVNSRRRYHPVLGSVLGMSAYLVNYAAIYLLLRIDGADWSVFWNPSISSSESNLMAKFAGQTLYNAHFAATRVVDDIGSAELNNYVTNPALRGDIASTVPVAVYLLVPVLVLVLAGSLLSFWRGGSSSRLRAATAGVSIVPGYLFLTIVGVRKFTIGATYTVTGPNNQLPAIVLVGILYPLVWGAIGGVIASELQ